MIAVDPRAGDGVSGHGGAPRIGTVSEVIALWLGHADVRSTDPPEHADMTHKQKAIDRAAPLTAKPGRYRPSDTILAFLEGL